MVTGTPQVVWEWQQVHCLGSQGSLRRLTVMQVPEMGLKGVAA